MNILPIISHPELKLHARVSWFELKRDQKLPTVMPAHANTVFELACEATGTTVAMAKTKNRRTENILARMLTAVYLGSNTALSLNAIGIFLGGKDHVPG